MRDGKKIKKKVVKAIASAGDAEGGKEGLGGWDRPDLARHGPGRLGGRIVCASRHPPRRIEGLEVCGLGGLEAWKNRKIAIL